MIKQLFGRKTMIGAALTAAAGLPIAFTENGVRDAAVATASSVVDFVTLPDESHEQPRATLADDWQTAGTARIDTSSLSTLAGDNVVDFRDVFRFDMSPPRIMQRWPRVTRITHEPFQVFRVPLVTGTEPDDLAGSLTWYFDERQQLQRLTFRGTTGDATRLVEMSTQYFELKKAVTLDAGLYFSNWNGVPTSVLMITHPAVIRSDRPHERLHIHMEINRPGFAYGLSDEVRQLIAARSGPLDRKL